MNKADGVKSAVPSSREPVGAGGLALLEKEPGNLPRSHMLIILASESSYGLPPVLFPLPTEEQERGCFRAGGGQCLNDLAA